MNTLTSGVSKSKYTARQCVTQRKLRTAPPPEPGQTDPHPGPCLKALTVSSSSLNVLHRARSWGAKGICQPKAQLSFPHHTVGTCTGLCPGVLLQRPDQSRLLLCTHLGLRGDQAGLQDMLSPPACTQEFQVQGADGGKESQGVKRVGGDEGQFSLSWYIATFRVVEKDLEVKEGGKNSLELCLKLLNT